MLRTVIIDDEERSRQTLKTLLAKYCSGVDVIAVADGVQSGIKCIEQHKPDLLLLDIRMQDGTGFELLQLMDNPTFQLIFTTAYDEYAIKAFKFSAIDYLLKPIAVEELESAIERAKNNLSKYAARDELDPLIKNLLAFNSTDPKITISTERTLEILAVRDIVRLESDGPYTYFIVSDGRKILSSKTLKHYSSMVEEYHFLRVHNSHVINLAYVTRYIKEGGGLVELQNGDQIPVSRRRKDAFLEMYTNR